MPRENFKREAKTRKNSVRTNHTFFREARHPFVYPARQRLQHISPISDLLESRSVIGVFSGQTRWTEEAKAAINNQRRGVGEKTRCFGCLFV